MFNLESLRRVTTGSGYLPVIDGLRFMAIVPVVLWHLNSRAWRAFSADGADQGSEIFEMLNRWLGAKTGVELFFVISGFILAMPFLRAGMEVRPQPSLKKFYLRRLTRLEPPYILATLGAFFFLTLASSSGFKASFENSNGFTLIDSLTASLFYLHGPLLESLPAIIPVAWSLEIEFQFYIVAPLLFYILLLAKSPIGRLAAGFFMLCAVVLSINVIQSEIGALIRFVLLRYLHFFLLGVVVCHVFLQQKILLGHSAKNFTWDVFFVVSLIVLMVTETQMSDYRRQTPVLLEFLRLLGLGCLFFSAFLGKYISKLLSLQLISIVGGMCYSIYLIHLPLQQVIIPKIVALAEADHYGIVLTVTAAISLPVTLIGALFFYVFIEKPCMSPDWPQQLWAKVLPSNHLQKKEAPPNQ